MRPESRREGAARGMYQEIHPDMEILVWLNEEKSFDVEAFHLDYFLSVQNLKTCQLEGSSGAETLGWRRSSGETFGLAEMIFCLARSF